MSYPKPKVFYPKNSQKYKGSYPIVCRSSLELKFFQLCDSSEAVLCWGSESLSVSYVNPIDKKIHRYFPDIFVKFRRADGKIKYYVIEIKPADQCVAPKRKKGKKHVVFLQEASTFLINMAKWQAARQFCRHNSSEEVEMEFRVVTDKDLQTGHKY